MTDPRKKCPFQRSLRALTVPHFLSAGALQPMTVTNWPKKSKKFLRHNEKPALELLHYLGLFSCHEIPARCKKIQGVGLRVHVSGFRWMAMKRDGENGMNPGMDRRPVKGKATGAKMMAPDISIKLVIRS